MVVRRGTIVYRSIQVQVDSSTWPNPPALPAYPTNFPTRVEQVDFSIPAVLLTIGVLTTPSHAVGVSLSEFWAWVRYLHAISEEPDLRVTNAFADLDAHQKTILSDDFGMGFPMHWLLDRLQIGPVCDGRYFIEQVSASIGAVAAKTAKRGPNKSPDFVAQDIAGAWHVIECKGTQSGRDYSKRQLGTVGPPAVGALAQKRTITFPAGHTGQRLACGLTIGIQNGPEPSWLRVVDPSLDNEFLVSEAELVYAEASSSAMSAPAGRHPSSRPGTGKAEQTRQEIIEEKATRAKDELRARTERRQFAAKGERYRGREVHFDLPAPVRIDEREVRSVRIRQGVNAKVLTELARRPLIEDPLTEAAAPWRETVATTETQSDRFSAMLRVGSFFMSELNLIGTRT